MGRLKGTDMIYFARCTTCGYLLCLGEDYDAATKTAVMSMPYHYEECHRGKRPGWALDVKLRREVDPQF